MGEVKDIKAVPCCDKPKISLISASAHFVPTASDEPVQRKRKKEDKPEQEQPKRSKTTNIKHEACLISINHQ